MDNISVYTSRAARDAEAMKYGSSDYWSYLDDMAKRLYDYYYTRGDIQQADNMLSRPLSEALEGNDGD